MRSEKTAQYHVSGVLYTVFTVFSIHIQTYGQTFNFDNSNQNYKHHYSVFF
jgi:hypothetical protein